MVDVSDSIDPKRESRNSLSDAVVLVRPTEPPASCTSPAFAACVSRPPSIAYFDSDSNTTTMHASTPAKSYQLRFTPHQQIKAATAVPSEQFGHRHKRARTVSQAQIGGMLDTVVTWGALAAGAGAVVYSVFYDWKQNKQQQQGQGQRLDTAALFGPPDNTTWTVMGVVSCIPFFNFLVSP